MKKTLLVLLLLIASTSVPVIADDVYLPEPLLEVELSNDIIEPELDWDEEFFKQLDASNLNQIEMSVLSVINTSTVLTQDTTYESLDLTAGTLDLNGFTLTISGDFNHSGGTMLVNGGKLNVSGDYKLQGTNGTSTSALINMTNSLDEIHVFGNFISNASSTSHKNTLIEGKLFVAGDVEQKHENFRFYGNSTLVLNGKDNPLVSHVGHLGNIHVANTNSNFKVNGLLYIKALSSSTDSVNISSITGEVLLDGKIYFTTSIPTVTFIGNVRVPDAGIYANRIYFNGSNVVINGNFQMEHGTVYLSSSTLNVVGNMILEKPNSIYNTATIEGVEDGKLIVNGNLYRNSTNAVTMKSVEFVVKGNLEFLLKPPTFEKLVLSGESVQDIVTARAINDIGNIVVNNSLGVRVNGALGFKSLTTTLDEAYFYQHPDSTDILLISNGAGLITGPFHFVGNLTLSDAGYSSVTVKDSTIKVTGILYQEHYLYVNNSTVIVGNDYFIQKIDGTKSSTGKLKMNHATAKLVVGDDVTINGGQIIENDVTAGRMTLGGNFIHLSDYFRPGADFVLEFAGNKEQIVKANKNLIHNIEVNNSNNTLVVDGHVIVSKFTSDSGVVNLKSTDGNVRILSDGETFFRLYDTLLTIEGNLILGKGSLGNGFHISDYGVLYVEGNLLLDTANLFVDKGTLVTTGNFKVAKEDGSSTVATLYQRDLDSYILVGGNFDYLGGFNIKNFETGVLEVKGDVNILTKPSFKLGHLTILSGDSPQSVFNVDGTQDYRFYHLILNKDISEFTFNKSNLFRTLGYGEGNEMPILPKLPENYSVLSKLGDNNVPTGNFALSETDLMYSAPGFELAFGRTYNSNDDASGLFGPRWRFSFESSAKTFDNGDALIKLPNGSVQFYQQNGSSYISYDTKNSLSKTMDGYVLTTKDRTVYRFNEAGYLVSMSDKYGNTTQFDVSLGGKVSRVVDQVGRVTTVEYGLNGFISKIIDPLGRFALYEYEGDKLVKATDPEGEVYNYSYDAMGYLTSIKDIDGVTLSSVAYDHENRSRVISKTNANGNVSTYYYNVIDKTVKIIDSLGRMSDFAYDKEFLVTSVTDPDGKTSATVYNKDILGRNRFAEVGKTIDRNGGENTYKYDSRGNVIEVTDALGGKSTYRYDQYNNLIETVGVNGGKTFFIYGSDGIYHLKTASPINGTDVYSGDDTNFIVTTYTYYESGQTGKGLLKSVTSPEGSATIYSYDSNGNISSVTVNGKTTSYVSNNLGWVEKEISPLGYETTFDYDLNGRLIRTTNDEGYVSRIVYDQKGNKVQEISSVQYDSAKDNHVTNIYSDSNSGVKIEYYPNGLVYKVTDALGGFVTYTYDLLGNVLTESKPNGAVSVYEYDVLSRVTKEYFKDNPSSHQVLVKEQVYTVLPDGRTEVAVKTYQDTGTFFVKTTTFDKLGRAIKATNPDGSVYQTVYNPDGTVHKEIDAKGTEMVYEYDKLGRQIKEIRPFEVIDGVTHNAVSLKSYDNEGRVIQSRELVNLPGAPESYSKGEYFYDVNGLLEMVILYDGDDKSVTQYHYDAEGRKVRMYTCLSEPLTILGLDVVSGADNDYSVTKYEYDHNGQMTKLINPLGYETVYEYDGDGRLILMIAPEGTTFSYDYDLNGNLLREATVTLDGEGQIDYTYTYDALGNRLTMIDDVKATTYIYDEKGYLVKETDSRGFETSYSYDFTGNRKSMVAKFGEAIIQSVTYNYDNMGRLVQVYEGGNLKATYTYDANGNRASLVSTNGTHAEYTYNLANSLKTITNFSGQTVLSGETYTYYLSGNIHEKIDNAGRRTQFIYDGLSRLKSEAVSIDGAEVNRTIYAYDDYNNRISKQVITSAESYTLAYQYDKMNMLLSISDSKNGDTSFTYDKNGNTLTEATSTETISYGYNSLNELISTTKGDKIVTFAYDGNRLRISKSVDGTTLQFLNDRDSVIAEILGAEVTASYLRGVNLIAMVDPQGEFEWYYHFNYHGDVTELTDTTGTVVKSYKYDAFGNEENIDSDDINPFRYTAEYFDKETGKIYLRARYYNPQVGRFINQDSYLGNQVDPLSLNLYTYTHNNPVMGVDPSGHIFETLLDVGSLIDSTITIFKEPSLINAGMLAWDVASVFIPGAPGSYVAKGAKLLSKADYVVDLGRSAKSTVKMVGNVDKIVDTTKSNKTFAQFNLQLFAGSSNNVKTYVSNGYKVNDINKYSELTLQLKRALGNKNIKVDNYVQGHHPIQNEWAKRWAKINGNDYSEYKAPAILLQSLSGKPHAKLSSLQRNRRKIDNYNTSIQQEFNISYRELIESGVDPKYAKKAMRSAYKYFDSLGGFN